MDEAVTPGRETTPPYPLYAFCAEQLPDDWREMSSASVALAILAAAADPAAPKPGRMATCRCEDRTFDLWQAFLAGMLAGVGLVALLYSVLS